MQKYASALGIHMKLYASTSYILLDVTICKYMPTYEIFWNEVQPLRVFEIFNLTY